MEKCGLTCDTMENVLFDIMGARFLLVHSFLYKRLEKGKPQWKL
jgi:hypothetical protein